jgi:hypothetical protein
MLYLLELQRFLMSIEAFDKIDIQNRRAYLSTILQKKPYENEDPKKNQ